MNFLRKTSAKFLRIKNALTHHFLPTESNSNHPYMLKIEALAVFLGLLIFLQIAVLSGAFGLIAERVPSFSKMMAAVLPAVLTEETNEYRTSNGVKDLKTNPVLAYAATLKAEDMAAKSYFSHIGPNGEKPWSWMSKVGYNFTYAGENLAINFVDSQDVTNAWINSPTHRQNLVSGNFTETGIGIAKGVYNNIPTTFVVQFFAKPYESYVNTTVKIVEPKTASTTIKQLVAVATTSKTVATTTGSSTAQNKFEVATNVATTTKETAVLSTTSITAATGTSLKASDLFTPVPTPITLNATPGAVLGLYTSNSTNVLDLLASNIYKEFFVSPKHFINDILLLLLLLVFVILIVTILHTAHKTRTGNSLSEKLTHSITTHKKILLYFVCFIVISISLVCIINVLFSGPVVVAVL